MTLREKFPSLLPPPPMVRFLSSGLNESEKRRRRGGGERSFQKYFFFKKSSYCGGVGGQKGTFLSPISLSLLGFIFIFRHAFLLLFKILILPLSSFKGSPPTAKTCLGPPPPSQPEFIHKYIFLFYAFLHSSSHTIFCLSAK